MRLETSCSRRRTVFDQTALIVPMFYPQIRDFFGGARTSRRARFLQGFLETLLKRNHKNTCWVAAVTHSEVEWMCMLAKFLQQPLLQPAVWFPLLRHRREGLTKRERGGGCDYIQHSGILLTEQVSPAETPSQSNSFTRPVNSEGMKRTFKMSKYRLEQWWNKYSGPLLK